MLHESKERKINMEREEAEAKAAAEKTRLMQEQRVAARMLKKEQARKEALERAEQKQRQVHAHLRALQAAGVVSQPAPPPFSSPNSGSKRPVPGKLERSSVPVPVGSTLPVHPPINAPPCRGAIAQQMINKYPNLYKKALPSGSQFPSMVQSMAQSMVHRQYPPVGIIHKKGSIVSKRELPTTTVGATQLESGIHFLNPPCPPLSAASNYGPVPNPLKHLGHIGGFPAPTAERKKIVANDSVASSSSALPNLDLTEKSQSMPVTSSLVAPHISIEVANQIGLEKLE